VKKSDFDVKSSNKNLHHKQKMIFFFIFRCTSLEGWEIIVITMTYGCLTSAAVPGLSLKFVVNRHRGDFLTQLLWQTWILPYMAGWLVPIYFNLLVNKCEVTIPVFFSISYCAWDFLSDISQVWGRWTSVERVAGVAAWSRASKWTLQHFHVQSFWNLLESRKEDHT